MEATGLRSDSPQPALEWVAFAASLFEPALLASSIGYRFGYDVKSEVVLVLDNLDTIIIVLITKPPFEIHVAPREHL